MSINVAKKLEEVGTMTLAVVMGNFITPLVEDLAKELKKKYPQKKEK